MVINGQQQELRTAMSLAQLLKQKGYRQDLVAVECNGRIIKQSEYGATLVDGSTVLEIVSFVGGG